MQNDKNINEIVKVNGLEPIEIKLLWDIKKMILQDLNFFNINSEIIKNGPINYAVVNDFLNKLQQIECLQNKKSIYGSLRLDIIREFIEKNFYIYEDKDFERKFLKKTGYNEVTEVGKSAAISALLTFATELNTPMSSRQAEEFVTTAMLSSKNPLKKLPPSFSMDEHELTFSRISLEIVEGETPIFDSITSRIQNNAEPFMGFIWSIFVNKPLQQYLYLYGQGQDGKGSICRLINNIVGSRAHTALDVRDDHWASKLIGKRIGIFNDINNTHVIQSSIFKQITGGDSVLLTEKHKAAFSAELDARIIITTNLRIPVSSQKSDIRRSIYCSLLPTDNIIENFEEKLLKEAPAILFKCKLAFEKLYDEGVKRITCSTELLQEEAENYEVKYSALFENHMKIDTTVGAHTTAENFYEYFSRVLNRNAIEYSKFLDYLERKHKLVISKTKIGEKVRRVMKNVTLPYHATTILGGN